MCFSYKLKSHVHEGESFEEGQPLAVHLKETTKIALETTKMHGVNGEEINTVIETICMCHDFGKASCYFQKYLRGEYRGILKNHGEISAYFTYYMLPEKWKMIGFMCVKRHHGNLEPDKDFFKSDNIEELREIALSIEQSKKELNEIYGKDISGFFSIIKEDSFFKQVGKEFINRSKDIKKKTTKEVLEEFIWIQYIWSLLLTADKTQLIRGKAYKNKIYIKEKYTKNYKEFVRNDIVSKFPEIRNSLLFNIRNKIYDEAIESINSIDLKKDKILSINVPTGTGKTVAVYGAAFRLFERILEESRNGIVPSIIYNIPFMSVIDQNYEVLTDILTKNNVKAVDDLILKHHSMSPIEYTDSEEKEYKNYDARFCVENWQSTIITTTFVQLFNTIFSPGINSIGHRFHKLAGSIIILDEVQAIPPKYYKIIEEVFQILSEKFNTYVITVTATKPLFLKGIELIGDNEKIFTLLNRIEIENYTDVPINLMDFCNIVVSDINKNEDESFLIVLNTVKSSLDVVNTLSNLKGRQVRYLSTEIHPQRRLDIIKEIKASKKKYILVSTQLIEAGVDLDFDVVYRDISTMDSINQTAGRANRNAIKEKGLVKLYCLIDEDHNNKRYSTYIYSKVLLEVTEKILNGRKVIEESEIGDINKEYFKRVKEVTNNKCEEDYEDIKKSICKLDFNKIRSLFKLIDDNYQKEDIIINYDDSTQKCIDIINNGGSDNQIIINAWRYLNRYRVSVDKKDLNNINTYIIKGANFLNKKYYDENRGIKISHIECT